MSFTCSPELGAESSAECFSGTGVSVLSRSAHTAEPSSQPARPTARSRRSRSSPMSEPSMLDPTPAELTSWLEAFPARHSRVRREAGQLPLTFGLVCGRSSRTLGQRLSLPRTYRGKQLSSQLAISELWVTPPKQFRCQRRTWVLTTFGSATGFLHTPTVTANFSAPSMQKWASCRLFSAVFGRPSPGAFEYLMGWPDGWTGLAPLEMGRFQSWQQQHSPCSQPNSTDSAMAGER